MQPWHNVFTLLPLDISWLRVLLFVAFGAHLLFVLLVLGTTIIGFVTFIKERYAGIHAEDHLSSRIMRSYLGTKSLAVVLGVAPLLIIQVLFYTGFFTSTALFAYTWIALIPLMIFSFLCSEHFSHRLKTDDRYSLFAAGLLGLISLLIIPAVFTGVLALLERPVAWQQFAREGILPADLFTVHWLLRYVHIIGAALILGGVYHLVRNQENAFFDQKSARQWILIGITTQIVVGLPLLATIVSRLDLASLIAIILAVFFTLLLVVAVLAQNTRASSLVAIALLLFLSMIAARQVIQDQATLPMRMADQARLEQQAVQLNAYQADALDLYAQNLKTVYNNGDTIYQHSCMPCHGVTGQGMGFAAKQLLIPAEDLTALRGDKAYLRGLILEGVHGTAMPYFTVFDKNKIDSLLVTLDKRFHMLTLLPKTAGPLSADARQTWAKVCSVCHGEHGEISSFGKTLQPAPPDLTRMQVTPERTLRILENGYPGTAMQPFIDLSPELRKELAQLTTTFAGQK